MSIEATNLIPLLPITADRSALRYGKYALITILTTGISQIIAIVGLIFLGIKAIYDAQQCKKYQNLVDQAEITPPEKAEHQALLNLYTQRCWNNKFNAKALGLSLINLSVSYAYGYLATSFAIAATDIMLATVGPQKLRTMTFYPGSNPSPKLHQAMALDSLHSRGKFFIECKQNLIEVKIPVNSLENRTIQALWLPYPNNPRAPSVIFFSPNAMNAEGSIDEAIWFRQQGFNILLITRNGYPGSPSDYPTTELRCYQDAEAARNWLKTTLGSDYLEMRTVAYGSSIGSTEAYYLGSKYPGIHVVTDVGLSSMALCIRNILRNHLPSLFSERSATFIGEYIILNLSPAGLTDGIVTTNGLDNLSRVFQVTGSIFGMAATEDSIMINSTHELAAQKKEFNAQYYPGDHLELQNDAKPFEALAKHLHSEGLTRSYLM